MKYNHKKIEAKWQKQWEKQKLYQPNLDKAKKPFYNLMMFPYPSAEGLHVGNMYAFVHSDAYGRFIRLKGFDIFEPIGLDGFGIHSENYAIKIKEHIKDVSRRTEKHFYEQLHMIGNQYDWSRTVETYKPDYYKWTQWLFLQMYKKGLAYRKKAIVNWCPSCKTVLSDEQVIVDKCERCAAEIVKKEMEQWFFKITDYAERLLKNLASLPEGALGDKIKVTENMVKEGIDWSEVVKIGQRNWIGKSEGAQFKMAVIASRQQAVKQSRGHTANNEIAASPCSCGAPRNDMFLEVFTTRLDTVFGCTYAVAAPEHALIQELKPQITNWAEVEKYINETKKKSDIQRLAEGREKIGVELKGIKVLNPFTNEAIPLFAADYVLGHYGTGAVMAVPAHDERDFEFAKKYNLPIKQSIASFHKAPENHPDAVRRGEKIVTRDIVYVIAKHWQEDKYLCLDWNHAKAWKSMIVGGVEEGEDILAAAKREAREESGYKNYKTIRELELSEVHSLFYAGHKKENRYARAKAVFIELKDGARDKIAESEQKMHKLVWVEKNKVRDFLAFSNWKITWDIFLGHIKAYTEDGIVINSGDYNGLSSEDARDKMAKWLEKNKLGKKTVNYKLRDWCVSRQRYWGPPIPMIECVKCGWRPVPEKDLPVLLPEMDDFLPDGSGKGPLNKVPEFVETKCPECGGPAKRETDVSDPFVDSCWYFLRYPSTEFKDKPFDKKRLAKWLPVDMYIGGKEHTVLHLLYARFVTMVLHDMGYLDFEEPFIRFFAHGLLIKEGAKMSKSKGNVINPDEYIAKFGADCVRMYLMFLGDARQGGDWQDSGINGMSRFLGRIWQLVEKICKKDGKQPNCLRQTHKIIKRVTEDLENLKFNTAIAALMEYVNYLRRTHDEKGTVNKKVLGYLALLLAPFAPHIAEEIWSKLGYQESVFRSEWPEYDTKLVQEDTIQMPVQINGKLRAVLTVPADISEAEARKFAVSDITILKWLGGKEPKKIIFAKGRLVNIVA